MKSYEDIGRAYCDACGCCLTEEQRSLIESELVHVYTKYLRVLRVTVLLDTEDDITEYKDAEELRRRVLSTGIIHTVLWSDVPINSLVYAKYRALHDVLHHVLGNLSFSYEDEYASWLMFKRTLEDMHMSEVTLAFCRYDILYKNALYHYRGGKPSASEVQKVVLEELCCEE